MYEQQQPPPGGAVALTLKYHPLAFMLRLFKPVVELNGHPVANAWGRQVIPVPAGQYHLHVHVPYFVPSRMGPADLPVTVYPGQAVELEYRAPMAVFYKGALGAPPQKYPGMVLMYILLAVAGLILLCVCGGSIVASVGGGSSSLGVPGSIPAAAEALRAGA